MGTLLLAAVLVLLNAVVLAQARNRPDVPLSQLVAQLLLVWLLPVVGALSCLLFVVKTHAGDPDPDPEIGRASCRERV